MAVLYDQDHLRVRTTLVFQGTYVLGLRGKIHTYTTSEYVPIARTEDNSRQSLHETCGFILSLPISVFESVLIDCTY